MSPASPVLAPLSRGLAPIALASACLIGLLREIKTHTWLSSTCTCSHCSALELRASNQPEQAGPSQPRLKGHPHPCNDSPVTLLGRGTLGRNLYSIIDIRVWFCLIGFSVLRRRSASREQQETGRGGAVTEQKGTGPFLPLIES